MFRLIKILLLIAIIFYVLHLLGYVDFDFKKTTKQVQQNTYFTLIKEKAIELTRKLGFTCQSKEKQKSSKSSSKDLKNNSNLNKNKDDITENDRQELNDLIDQY